jgi:hypothetical protein
MIGNRHTPASVPTFATMPELVAYSHEHGLRGLSTFLCQYPADDRPAICSASVTFFESSRFSAYGTGRTAEEAESRAIARALSFALGIPTMPTSAPAPAPTTPTATPANGSARSVAR